MTDQYEYRNIVVASNVAEDSEFRRDLDEQNRRMAGMFFAPYVPLTQTPVVLDPNSFRTDDIMARYSREALDEGQRYYGRIIFDMDGVRETDVPIATYQYEEPKPVNWLKEGF